jgi:hypothetical protein
MPRFATSVQDDVEIARYLLKTIVTERPPDQALTVLETISDELTGQVTFLRWRARQYEQLRQALMIVTRWRFLLTIPELSVESYLPEVAARCGEVARELDGKIDTWCCIAWSVRAECLSRLGEPGKAHKAASMSEAAYGRLEDPDPLIKERHKFNEALLAGDTLSHGDLDHFGQLEDALPYA